MSAEDGGSAFPVGAANDAEPSAGISVRDYFAIKILAAFLSKADGIEFGKGHGANRTYSNAAYSLADTMLAVRKKGGL